MGQRLANKELLDSYKSMGEFINAKLDILYWQSKTKDIATDDTARIKLKGFNISDDRIVELYTDIRTAKTYKEMENKHEKYFS